MKFDALVNKLLLFEMPHVDEGNVQFDFEVETFPSDEEGYRNLVNNVKGYLSGKETPSRVASREGLVYKLPEGGKDLFIQYIKDNMMLQMMLLKRFKKNIEQFIADIN